MSVVKSSVAIVKWKDLSEAIKDELYDMGKGHLSGFLFWVKAPSTAKEIAMAPNLHEFLRSFDVPAGSHVLVEG